MLCRKVSGDHPVPGISVTSFCKDCRRPLQLSILCAAVGDSARVCHHQELPYSFRRPSHRDVIQDVMESFQLLFSPRLFDHSSVLPQDSKIKCAGHGGSHDEWGSAGGWRQLPGEQSQIHDNAKIHKTRGGDEHVYICDLVLLSACSRQRARHVHCRNYLRWMPLVFCCDQQCS